MGVKTCAATQARNKSDAADPANGCYEMTSKAPEIAGPSASAKSNDKQHCGRRRGMEKSVLDDIMEDVDDFRDLAYSDAESEGGRWGDTVRETAEEVGAFERDPLIVPMEPENQGAKVKNPNNLARKELEIGSASERSSQVSSGGQHLDVKEKGKHTCSKTVENGPSDPSKLHQTRYFVIKSLNHHNISKSIQKGIWATQAMNEPILNEAFETSERVLLIFSVNMSGHFQGYAQMVSSIGRRRADVWNESNSGSNPWGGSFSVHWLRLYDLPFQKTVHLKNPLNSFKPVKISRDCQELPEDIGQALCALIDEGAEKEGKMKRRPMITDSATLKKRLRGDVAASSFGMFGSECLPVHTRGVLMGSMYSSAAMHDSIEYQLPVTRPSGLLPSTSLAYFEQAQSSMSRSPRRSSTEINIDSEREYLEGKGRISRREKEQRASDSINSTDLPPEEDLLNMTYEEYLQRHGKSRELSGYNQTSNALSPYQTAPVYGPGWMCIPPIGYSNDQYSNYLAKWYSSQQGSTLLGDCYFASGTVANPFSGIHPPHC